MPGRLARGWRCGCRMGVGFLEKTVSFMADFRPAAYGLDQPEPPEARTHRGRQAMNGFAVADAPQPGALLRRQMVRMQGHCGYLSRGAGQVFPSALRPAADDHSGGIAAAGDSSSRLPEPRRAATGRTSDAAACRDPLSPDCVATDLFGTSGGLGSETKPRSTRVSAGCSAPGEVSHAQAIPPKP